MSIQQMLLGVGAVATKTYVDDIFSTFLYTGNNNSNPDTQSINNGIDLSTEGGFVWIKSRTNTYNHILQDTVNGTGKFLVPNTDGGTTNTNQYITSFNTNGFSLGTDNDINNSSQDFSSWSFRKAPGFCDVVSWTGNGNGSRQISHSLESVPGCIMIKRTDDSYGWYVYHRGLDSSNPERYYLRLNEGDGSQNTTGQQWMAAAPTSTNFTLAADIGGSGYEGLNTNGDTYVAYVFAGGESTAATARSVEFDGNDWLKVPASSDFNIGTGNFCFEGWYLPQHSNSNGFSGSDDTLVGVNDGGFELYKSGSTLKVRQAGTSNVQLTSSHLPEKGQWTHIAVTRSGTAMKMFFNGTQVASASSSASYTAGSNPNDLYIGNFNYPFTGKISNVRLVNGSAVYTSSFRPPTEPLTNITNTKLLFCNNSSVTGSTVSPTTIVVGSGDPTASTDSPFDDPAAFTFGDAGDQGVVKCGSYTKTDTGSSNTLHIELGWEPQLILQKRSDGSDDWYLMDVMREMSTELTEILRPNSNGSEVDYGSTIVVPTATGFTVKDNNSDSYIYLAIRSPDGYVGKPPELGTGVFAMDTGSGSSTIPTYDSGFPVDWALRRSPASSSDWFSYQRLLGTKYVKPNTTDDEETSDKAVWDSNVGFFKTDNSSKQAWMFKRHAGMDVVAYGPGNEVEGRPIQHSLNKIPEMIWLKNRDSTDHWIVYHKGLNGGTNPEQYYLWLDTTNAEDSTSVYWNSTAPTSTHFTVGNGNAVNQNNKNYIAMLFASVDGISKVGSFTGTGSTQTITLGFQPRFLILKMVNSSSGAQWYVLDTVRGWGSGDDNFLELNTGDAQTGYNFGAPTSTGFELTATAQGINASGDKMIYYAHA